MIPEATGLRKVRLPAAEAQSEVFLGMTAIIASEPMLRLMEVVRRVARSSATTLVTIIPAVPASLGSISTALRCPNSFWKANYSVTSGVPSAEPIPPNLVCSSWPIRAPFSWMKWENWTGGFR
jgi:hypothetical protein